MHLPVLTQIETVLHENSFGALLKTYSNEFCKNLRHQCELTNKDNSVLFSTAQSQA
jgi:hypothetical protein